MNILNFNNGVHGEWFDRFGMSKACAMAPVFYGKDITQAELFGDKAHENLAALLKSGGKLLPFPKTRLWLDANVEDRSNGYSSFRYYCEEFADGSIRLLSVAWPVKGAASLAAFNLIQKDGKINLQGFHVSGQWVEWAKLAPWLKEKALNSCHAHAASAGVFFAEVQSPANFVARVHPKAQGKSVTWTGCRTHFVVIHKSHPANKPELFAGASVIEDEGYTNRQAHSRRAHFRVLRSPRFRHKTGQRIWVKSAWIGPREWQQASSIYRIHECSTT